jgi:hypothetical protein
MVFFALMGDRHPQPAARRACAEQLMKTYSVMRFWISCTATFSLPHCIILIYIHFNDEAFAKG